MPNNNYWMFFLLLCSRRLNCWVEFWKYIVGLGGHIPSSLNVVSNKLWLSVQNLTWEHPLCRSWLNVSLWLLDQVCYWFGLFLSSKDIFYNFISVGNSISSCKIKEPNHGNWLLKSFFYLHTEISGFFPNKTVKVFKHLQCSSAGWSNSPYLFLFIRIFSTATCKPYF